MPFEPNTHHTVKTREGTMPGRVTPYILLTSEEGQMIIQGGEWYTAGGVPVDEDDVPQWAWDASKKLSPETRDSLGLEPLAPGDAPKASRPAIDIDGQTAGNAPMQLNADDAATDGKASPVPQGPDAASPKAAAKTPPPPTVKK